MYIEKKPNLTLREQEEEIITYLYENHYDVIDYNDEGFIHRYWDPVESELYVFDLHDGPESGYLLTNSREHCRFVRNTTDGRGNPITYVTTIIDNGDIDSPTLPEYQNKAELDGLKAMDVNSTVKDVRLPYLVYRKFIYYLSNCESYWGTRILNIRDLGDRYGIGGGIDRPKPIRVLNQNWKKSVNFDIRFDCFDRARDQSI